MKNLDLNNYGVQEMNAVEMRVTDGGFNDRPFGKGDGPPPSRPKKDDGVLTGLIIILAGLLSL